MIDPATLSKQQNVIRIGRTATETKCSCCGRRTTRIEGVCFVCSKVQQPIANLCAVPTDKLIAIARDVKAELERRKREIEEAI